MNAIEDVGVIAAALVAVLTAVAILARWARAALRAELEKQIAPIHRRIDDHMLEEETALNDVAVNLAVIANHVGVTLPKP